ncbi:MAG: SDR family oxidoreductase [Anaerolineales bacterium]
MDRSTERVVLITGASSGIGKASAAHLARRGWQVYGTSRTPQPVLPQPAGCKSLTMIPLDVTDAASVSAAVSTVVERAGRLDAVVNNAGVGLFGPLEEVPLEEVRAHFETNVFGLLRVCQAALPALRRQGGGYIVNIGSLAGQIALPFQGIYSAAKFAVEGLTEALRMEVRPFGVHVVLVEPGDVATAFTAHRRRVGGGAGSPYASRAQGALAVAESDEQNGISPRLVAYLLARVLDHPHPRLRYTVAGWQQRLAPLLRRWLPDRWVRWLLMQHYGL